MVGYLPHLPGCAIESRHLGLKTAGEVADLQQKLGSWPMLLCWTGHSWQCCTDRPAPAAPPLPTPCAPAVRIAVARDEAFCFAYAETLDALRDAGAELVVQPAAGCRPAGKYRRAVPARRLPGAVRKAIERKIAPCVPISARRHKTVCPPLPSAAAFVPGQALEGTDGKVYPMAGVLPGSGHNAGRLVRFGYAAMTAKADSMLFRAGEALPIHEFHHWDSSENGADFSVAKPKKGSGDAALQTRICTPVSRIFTGRALPCPAALYRRRSTF